MDAEGIVNHVMNDQRLHAAVTDYVRRLRNVMDRAAEAVADANAQWADDPEWEQHDAYHAPADTQFPAEVRDAAALDLFKHYLGELAIQRKAGAK